MNALEHHVPLLFPVVNNELMVGGMPITRLAARVGRTPFYVYDRAIIKQRVKALRQVLPPEVHVHYAIKANPMPAVVQQFAALIDGFDVASAREMRIALDTPMPASHISFAGPGKQRSELSQAIAAGVVIIVESEAELELIIQLGQELALLPQIMLRVNPPFELKSSRMKMGGGAKPFGIDAEQIPTLLAQLPNDKVAFLGFHVFAGSQNLNAAEIIESITQTIALIRQLSRHCTVPIKYINLGGGFGIPYFPGDQLLDLKKLGTEFTKQLTQAKTDFPQTMFIVELGRALIGEAGIYVTQVTYLKESHGQRFLITDGGLHHHLNATGNMGQLVRKNYPLLVANRVVSDNEPSMTNVVGLLCSPRDILAENAPLGHAQAGDLIAILQSGAYGLTASPLGFLGHEPPLEVLV
ncbi:pyridoxal-dependent decarboxylase, exosortase A system-associated [Thiospirillum jenense]|uniref:Pyridoxal-dependent decarboxylase, exosortase A system-associated n=1 Tax=Thiospirillum jenense TaxID=1653858 RepID=A0A839H6H9_9GAMM|nr:pyridoxal-dependent decarboxylase, exosortase A system-associated [Thiospirillum jenense]MBB1125375.1 pyridoxal-dependent decarboxylase, exosortase A system-associated [Thiospirillum jenense]